MMNHISLINKWATSQHPPNNLPFSQCKIQKLSLINDIVCSAETIGYRHASQKDVQLSKTTQRPELFLPYLYIIDMAPLCDLIQARVYQVCCLSHYVTEIDLKQ